MAYGAIGVVTPRWLTFPTLMMVVYIIMGATMLKGGITGRGWVLPSAHPSLIDRVLHVLGGLLLMAAGGGGLYVGMK